MASLYTPLLQVAPAASNPSCPQATSASVVSQRLSHTVPQTWKLQISTRPLVALPP